MADEPVARALRTIKECQAQFETVADYTCKFYKRERIQGRLTPLHVMEMKARTQPKSIYFKFEEPYKGREAIYVEGRNEGKVLAHDVGFTKFLAGTLELEPTSARAMADNRHPITDAGIGALIDTVSRRWTAELSPDESILVFDENMTIGPRRCLMVESIHPRRQRPVPVLQGPPVHRFRAEPSDPLRGLRLAQGRRGIAGTRRGILLHRPETQCWPRRRRLRQR